MSAVAKDTVVSLHYTVRNKAKEVVDTSSGGEPLLYLHGRGQIIPGLERALEGRKIGDKFDLRVEPKDAYGDHDARMVQAIERSRFPKGSEITVGMMFELSGGNRRIPVVVKEVTETSVTVDGNHPLAGQELFFEVEVIATRAATKEELEHGHAHGAGGHHHG